VFAVEYKYRIAILIIMPMVTFPGLASDCTRSQGSSAKLDNKICQFLDVDCVIGTCYLFRIYYHSHYFYFCMDFNIIEKLATVSK
jgi:hypothetical protein